VDSPGTTALFPTFSKFIFPHRPSFLLSLAQQYPHRYDKWMVDMTVHTHRVPARKGGDHGKRKVNKRPTAQVGLCHIYIFVIPAKAGIHGPWIPAFAGMTVMLIF